MLESGLYSDAGYIRGLSHLPVLRALTTVFVFKAHKLSYFTQRLANNKLE